MLRPASVAWKICWQVAPKFAWESSVIVVQLPWSLVRKKNEDSHFRFGLPSTFLNSIYLILQDFFFEFFAAGPGRPVASTSKISCNIPTYFFSDTDSMSNTLFSCSSFPKLFSAQDRRRALHMQVPVLLKHHLERDCIGTTHQASFHLSLVHHHHRVHFEIV